ncbi:hypothetical protein FDA94_29410 [Herbidospora galbida]|uniref:Uncharacterized protein n=1 Tax=Herbidospora galbida TaxID=2575442 RepID=A0A4U3M846_9ACTN|nr:hypothetical protein [Herbidospora galbida]TKK84462.1 hypothetical protein FDA94_29410 [Herbidospora galbida]
MALWRALGLDDVQPVLSRQCSETSQARSHACHVWTPSRSRPGRRRPNGPWDYPDRTENQPLPIFARRFRIPKGKKVADARLYLSGSACTTPRSTGGN